MLNEPGHRAVGQPDGPPVVRDVDLPRQTYEPELETAVRAVMAIERIEQNTSAPVVVAFTGRLLLESSAAFEQLDQAFAAVNCHAILTQDDQGRHVVLALRGRAEPKPRPVWPNVVLLLFTLLSLLYVGAAHEAGMKGDDDLSLWRGIPYAASMLLILGSHELGHYFAGRYHGVHVTLPYFIPFPGFFGTMGAFIQIRGPMRNRKQLFDLGVAGPLAGLVVALPILIIGLATSKVEPLPTGEDYLIEGNSALYAGAKYAVFGRLLPGDHEDVFINQLAKAGWTGLFLTGLNLIPLGQLDGGHIMFTLFGVRARRLYWPVVGAVFLLSFFNSVWLLWALLLFFLGRAYATPLDSVTELDRRRRWLGYVTLVIFVLVFVPSPLTIVTAN